MEKKYPLFSNLWYGLKELYKAQGAKAYLICVGDILLNVGFPFLGMALPSVVVALLVSGREPAWILLVLAGYLLLFQGIRVLQSWTSFLKIYELFDFRDALGKKYTEKCIRAESQFWESTKGQKKAEDAEMNIYQGNQAGAEAYLSALTDVVANLLGMLIYAVVIGQWCWWLMLVLALFAVLVSGANSLATKQSHRLFNEKPGYASYLHEWRYLREQSIVPKNGKDIRLYRLKEFFLNMMHGTARKIACVGHKMQQGYLAANITEKGLGFLRDVLVYGFLIYQMMQGRIDISVFLLYVGTVAGFGAWMSGVFDGVQEVLENDKYMSQYRDFMDSGIVETEGKALPAKPGKPHEIRLEHVSFRYEEAEEDTIHDVNLTIRAGEKIALVGVNGVGKTTLIKLICGIYHPTAGKIYLDGQDVSELNQLAYFKEFAVVFQNVFAFSFSLEDNVSCAEREKLDREKLETCLKKADLWEKVVSLPEGSRTMMNKDLDENGVTLSGGELQKLMLARALYKEAPVIILDEPTAALDPIAESEMYGRYYEMTKEKTSVFISHRLSSTRFCNRILFMAAGRITEEGSHEELMAKKGAYAEMFAVQAQYYQKAEQGEECYV